MTTVPESDIIILDYDGVSVRSAQIGTEPSYAMADLRKTLGLNGTEFQRAE